MLLTLIKSVIVSHLKLSVPEIMTMTSKQITLRLVTEDEQHQHLIRNIVSKYLRRIITYI